ncbi:hypothetical protein [Campylobacter canadensis]|uniref:UPF0323 domain-containing protein n=1 Tax=Campylobacter canadensis TaxID=449520 RepID=A0ABS7WSC5_9BACT|nr:hypothetical protein [Campylobacter canadensis]MBZ7987663.1 hypothetical protein [Campylobacter canadensis]MBZ7995014.1 hypothetical protein [Campylobacter canadensis]MBZ7996956.1 hypothetical protein [Campylobacter canadensis]MBZ7998800.1 hypothetical protein [Campylobacter canadensis]MBZ8000435.1 hypothetical protein [Campylobacter canadensis]
MNKYTLQISAIASGLLLSACGAQEEQKQAQGSFLIIEEYAPKQYKIKEEFPAEETRVVLKELNGNERILSKEELDEIIKAENAKIDNNSSSLTNSSISSSHSLGEVLLSSVAGAIIGSWIGNKLFNNSNFANQKASHYQNPSAYQKSVNSFNKTSTSSKSSSKSSGFFKNSGSSSSSKTGSFGS